MANNDLAPMVAMVAMFLLIGWLVRTLTVSRRLKMIVQGQLELQGKLVDRFGSAEELAAYLNSDAGRRLLEVTAVERSTPYTRILGSIQTGIVLCFGGAAFLLMRGTMKDALEGFTFVGTLGLCLGLAFLVSAGVAWALSRQWGLIDGRPTLGEPGA